MSEARDLTDALDAMMRSDRADTNSLPALPVRGAKPRAVSTGVDAPVQATGGDTGGGAGAIGDYTETSYADRQYYATRQLVTTDGVFMFQSKPIKLIKMTDKDSKVVTLGFKAPT